MDVVVPSGTATASDLASKVEVLADLEPLVAQLMERHLDKRRLWMPSDFMPADERDDEDEDRRRRALRQRARGIPDPARVALALNLVTEEGLPHFHRILAVYLGDDSFWSRWNHLWTAEEDRHGAVLRDYARESRLFKWREVEMMQHAYQEAGFTPDWDRDPYRVFVYTTLQERATQASHRNTGKVAGEFDPTIGGILQNVAAEEARHFNFYREIFRAVLERDPNRALQSALAVIPSLEMPGMTMPNFKELADVVRRVGIYGPWDYKKIVEEALAHWKIELLTGLDEVGRKAQELIMDIPKRLEKVAQYIERRSTLKSFSFDLVYGRTFSLA